MQVLFVAILLQSRLQCAAPLLIPVLALYMGGLCRLVILVIAYYHKVHRLLPLEPASEMVRGLAMSTTQLPFGAVSFLVFTAFRLVAEPPLVGLRSAVTSASIQI